MRILVVTAHPDDVDFGAGGAVATWAAEGHEVGYCICTSGDAGEGPDGLSRAEVAALREEEQTAAAAAVGVTDVVFLRFADGRLEPTIALRREVSRAIRRFRPDRMVCQSPVRDLALIVRSHPDHLAAGEAALCALYPDAGNPHAHPELLAEGHEPWSCREAYVMGAGGGDNDVYVDITDAFDAKVAALQCHASQVGSRDDLDELLRGWGARNAAAGGLAKGRLAEGFQRIAF